MANIALVSGAPAYGVRPDYNATDAVSANPRIQWPSIGSGTRMRERNFVPVVSPTGSVAAGGATSGQLFPVGNR